MKNLTSARSSLPCASGSWANLVYNFLMVGKTPCVSDRLNVQRMSNVDMLSNKHCEEMVRLEGRRVIEKRRGVLQLQRDLHLYSLPVLFVCVCTCVCTCVCVIY